MSFNTIRIGASSLYAAQRATEVAAHNVANANSPGYTKQRLSVTSSVPTAGTAGMRGDGMRGTGVAVISIDRLRDLLADLSYRAEAGASGAADARAAVLDRAQTVLGEYSDGTAKDMDEFFKAWQTLSTKADDAAARAGVLSSGRKLAESLGTAADRLDQLGDDIGLQMQESVREVNDLAAHVATLNQGISDAITGGQSPNDLQDQRDSALDRLATLTGGTVKQGENGQVDFHVGGSPVVSGVTTRTLTASRTGDVWGVAFSDGRPAGVGGQLGAHARAVSVDLPAFGQQLDELAAALAERVNALHRTGHSLDSDGSAPDGGDFFVGAGGAAVGARTLQVRPDLTEDGIAVSVDGARFDGRLAPRLAELGRSGDPSVEDMLHAAISRMGAGAAAASRDAAAAQSGLSGAAERRSSAVGVNVDEEMVDLVKYQHSYQAAARVISMADSFLDTVINRMGAGR